MTSSRDFDCVGYARDLKDRGLHDKANDIDALLAVADDGERWSDEFLEEATVRAKKQFLRKLFRAGFHDEDGNLIQGFRIKVTDEQTGEIRDAYKQLEFWTIDDFEYAIRDCRRRIKSEGRKLKMLCRLAVQRFGRDIQLRFEFKLPVGKPAASKVQLFN